MTNVIERTVLLEKRGRKWFEAAMGKYKCKVMINHVSEHLEAGHVVKLRASDISDRSKYGVVMKFEPMEVLTDRTLEVALAERAARADLAEAEKWMSYAESDAAEGRFRTNAIMKVTNVTASDAYKADPSLIERKAVLVKQIAENELRDAKEREKRAMEAALVRARKATAEAKMQRQRILIPTDPYFPKPEIGKVCRFHGELIIVEEYSDRLTRISDDDPCMGMSYLLGREGDWARWAYFRSPTEGEIAAAKADACATRVAA